MVVLVTGGAGFIGSHIVRALAQRGESVRVLDDFSSGKRSNIADVADDVELIEGDLRDAGDVARAVAGAEVVFHQGAIASVPRSVADPRTSVEVGVNGTLNVLLAARDHEVRRVVFASSSAVYGNAPEIPKREEMTPRPLSPYAISKLSAEHLCSVFSRLYGLETVSLRYFNVFGPNQDPSSEYAAVIPRFIAAMKTGERPIVYGDGEQTRDFIYIDNAVDANLRAASAPGAAGGVYNVASSRAISINQVLQLLRELLGVSAEATYLEPRPGDINHSLADVSAACEVLGFEPKISFEEGLRRTVAPSVPTAFS